MAKKFLMNDFTNDQRQWSYLNVGDADLECVSEYNLDFGFQNFK